MNPYLVCISCKENIGELTRSQRLLHLTECTRLFEPTNFKLTQDIIFKVASVYGSWTFSKAELLEIARFMVEARVPLQKLITHRYDLDQAVEAFRTFDGATTGKCVFVMD